MLIAKTKEESDRFVEWTNEEIDDVLRSLPEMKHKPHISSDEKGNYLCYRNACIGISDEIKIFMESNISAYEYIASEFMESFGFDSRECFKTKNIESIKSRSCFLEGTYIEDLLKYGKKSQEEKNKFYLFGDDNGASLKKPTPVYDKNISGLFLLEKEKEYLGVYLSGHPLDYFEAEISKYLSKGNTIKTKKYGTLMVFKSISDMLASRYNKSVIICYCGRTYLKKTKRTINKVVCLSTEEESFEIEDREFSNQGGVYLNNIEQIEAMNAYLIVTERNRFANNGIQIINSFNLKTK